MADRPLECSECTKSLCYHYTYVDLERVQCNEMCEDCPILAKKIFQPTDAFPQTGLCCGQCGTSLEELRLGSSLGCTECYEVFADLLFSELIKARSLDSKEEPYSEGKQLLLHVGRVPGESTQVNVGMRLLSLNEALNETLNREDYEQAAWLRDQIKQLKEKGAKDGYDNDI